jgi:sugar fermentation stimulation protein A
VPIPTQAEPVAVSLLRSPDEPLAEARFVARPNRFVVHARLAQAVEAAEPADSDDPVVAHLPDPGRLRELLLPGRRLWLRPAPEPEADRAPRKTRWTVALVEAPGGPLVSVDTGVPNRLVAEALRRGALPELGGYRLERAEVSLGEPGGSKRSRFDFLLTCVEGERPPLLLEVKSATLVEQGVARFPDAVTARGARHVRELTGHARGGEHAAAILFVAQRPDVERVVAAREIDPGFADALDEAREAGVRVLARRCRVELDRIVLGEPVPVGRWGAG